MEEAVIGAEGDTAAGKPGRVDIIRDPREGTATGRSLIGARGADAAEPDVSGREELGAVGSRPVISSKTAMRSSSEWRADSNSGGIFEVLNPTLVGQPNMAS